MEQGDMNVTRGFKVSGMPMSQWLRWEKDCKENYGDCYWLKIISDHKKSKDYDVLVGQIMTRFEELDKRMDKIVEAISIEEVEEEKEIKPETLGGE